MVLSVPETGSTVDKRAHGVRRQAALVVWAVTMICVIVGSLLAATSSVMASVGRLHVSDIVLHSGAYMALSLLPVIGVPDRRGGVVAGLSIFLLGLLLEGAPHFAPGRAVEPGEVLTALA